MINQPEKYQEFLLYKGPDGKVHFEVYLYNETLWLTQKKMAELFDVNVPAISKHLQNIYNEGELQKEATVSILETVQKEGNRNVTRTREFYNLDAIIAVGYRVNSKRATHFRIWATQVLKEYIIKGFAMDDERLKNPQNVFGKDFFATVQNKLHWAITGQTAAEIIHSRADSSQQNMGLTNWKNSPKGKIRKTDVDIAKNYLNKEELDGLNRIVTMYLDYAENQARKGIVMYMKDWIKKLDAFLKFNNEEILKDSGKISHEVANALAENEFEKYKVIQDKLYESDFDKEIKKKLKGKE